MRYRETVPSSETQYASALVRDFRASMPPSYRRAHGWAAIQEHAAIVERRGEALMHIEVWRVRRGTVIADGTSAETLGDARVQEFISGTKVRTSGRVLGNA